MKTCMLTLMFLLLMAGLAGCDEAPSGEGSDDTLVALAGHGQPPVYRPDPVQGSFMFVIDRSVESRIVDPGRTHSRLEIATAHAWSEISALTTDDSFQVMSFGAPTTDTLFSSFRRASSVSKAAAHSYLRSLTPQGPSPQYSALYGATRLSPQDLSRMYFYSAGTPGADPLAPGGTATYTNILADIPAWWLWFNDAQMVALRVGETDAQHGYFMQVLAALLGGTYLDL